MKTFRLVLALLLVVGFAASVGAVQNDYAAQNVVILGASGGPEGISPMTEIVKVRYGKLMSDINRAGLSSGDVVVWDTTSSDGITISMATVDSPTTGFAGVLVTSIASADNGSVRLTDRNWGYMAVRGYCLAKVDTSKANIGSQLCLNGSTLYGSFGTGDACGLAAGSISQDIGTLLGDTGSDGLQPVWLK